MHVYMTHTCISIKHRISKYMWLLENDVFDVAAYGITDDRMHVI